MIAVIAGFMPGTAQKATEWESDGYSLRLIPDSVNSVEITRYSGDESELRIPGTFRKDGTAYSVSSIGRQAFYYNRNLKEAILPDGLTNIGEMAFTGCHNLQTVVLPGTVVTIAPFAFTETGVRTMVLPDGV